MAGREAAEGLLQESMCKMRSCIFKVSFCVSVCVLEMYSFSIEEVTMMVDLLTFEKCFII